jgi:hypothetical protein
MRLVPVRARQFASGAVCEGHDTPAETVTRVARKSRVEAANVFDDDTSTAKARPTTVAATARRPRIIGPSNSNPNPDTTPPFELHERPPLLVDLGPPDPDHWVRISFTRLVDGAAEVAGIPLRSALVHLGEFIVGEPRHQLDPSSERTATTVNHGSVLGHHR